MGVPASEMGSVSSSVFDELNNMPTEVVSAEEIQSSDVQESMSTEVVSESVEDVGSPTTPATTAPVVTPPAAPTPTEADTLRAQVAALQAELNRVSTVGNQQPRQQQAPVDQAPVKFVASDDDYKDILSSPDGMNKFGNAIRNEAVKAALMSVPDITVPIAQEAMQQVMTVMQYKMANPDLAQHSAYVGSIASQLQEANPNATADQILQAAYAYARERLGMSLRKVQSAQQAQVPPATVTPVVPKAAGAIPPAGGARIPPAPRLNVNAQELQALDDAFFGK